MYVYSTVCADWFCDPSEIPNESHTDAVIHNNYTPLADWEVYLHGRSTDSLTPDSLSRTSTEEDRHLFEEDKHLFF